MKEAASNQMGAVTDATASLGKGLKKSIKNYGKEAGRFAKSLSEFVDVEDILKSIHKVAHPEEHAQRKSSIVHTPIDWSKYPPSAFRKYSEELTTTIQEENEEGQEEGQKESYNSEQSSEEDDGIEEKRNAINELRTTGQTNKEHNRRRSSSIVISNMTSNNKNSNRRFSTVNELRTSQMEDKIHETSELSVHNDKQRNRRQSSYILTNKSKQHLEHVEVENHPNPTVKPIRTRHNSLTVNHMMSSRDYRCPSPRMGRRKNSSACPGMTYTDIQQHTPGYRNEKLTGIPTVGEFTNTLSPR